MKCPRCHKEAGIGRIINVIVTKAGQTRTTKCADCSNCGNSFKKHYYTDFHKKVKGPAE